MDRRSFGLSFGVSLLAVGTGCGGGGGSDAAGSINSPALDHEEWNPGELFLVPGGGPFDLRVRLPDGVPRGGRFQIAGHGAALPAGVVMLPDGELRATAAAPFQTISGVIFEYTYD
jgi:hypothetical protein